MVFRYQAQDHRAMKYNFRLSVFLFSLFLSLSACQANTTTEPEQSTEQKSEPRSLPDQPSKGVKAVPQAKPFHGTIRYMPLEGGFFGIITDRGLKILPLNLDKQYHQDGAEIEFTGVFVNDVQTIQQWGRPFRLSGVELVKPGKPVQPDNSAL